MSETRMANMAVNQIGYTEDAQNQARRAEEIDNYLLQVNFNQSAQIEAMQDPTLAYQLQRFAFGVPTNIKFGRVQMHLPHANWYKVVLDDMGGELPCVKLGSCGGYRYLGARDASNITPDSKVLVIVHNSASSGVIIGVVPELTEDGNHTYSDWVSQGSGVGILRNKYFSEYINLLSDEGGATVSSNGSPLDATSLDLTYTTETGLQLHLDPFMAYLRVDEGCGLFAYYHDRMLRVAGEQLDIWSGVRVEEDRNDEGEGTTFRGETPYPYELLGSFKANTEITKEIEDEAVLHKDPLAKLEPKEQALQPFTRYQEYGGYLGQAKIRQVVIPPSAAGDLNLYTDKNKDICVFREQLSLDGGYAVASAKSVIISRRPILSQPKRIRPSADYKKDDCDSIENANYKFAGKFGSGEDHKVGDVAVEFDERNLLSAAGILNYHAYVFNWKGPHPFHYHKKDFYIPQESEYDIDTNQYLPPFADLAKKTWLPTPSPEYANVDDRYNDVMYWKLMQHMSMTEDGAIVIQAGQGEEIKLGGGGIQISTPGRILIQSGSTTAVLAGDDFIARAVNSADITATHKDVRLKAQVNMQLLSGNGGEGVLLLENRADYEKHEYPPEGGEAIKGSGVVLKSKTVAATLAENVYIRSGASGGAGDLILDGNKGNNTIRMIGSTVERFVRVGFKDSIGMPKVETVNITTGVQMILGSALAIKGSVQADGSAMFRQGVTSTNGHFSSSVGGPVTRINNRQELNVNLDRIGAILTDQKDQQQQAYDYDIRNKYYITGKIGLEDTIKKVSFSLRPEKQYGTLDFKLPQVHWQILNNVIKAGKAWKEEDVAYQSEKYQPWPGKKAWQEQDSLLTLPPDSFTMYDIEKGLSKDRPGQYLEPKVGAFIPEKPSSHYFVIPSED